MGLPITAQHSATNHGGVIERPRLIRHIRTAVNG
jgi:hypothetical protein